MGNLNKSMLALAAACLLTAQAHAGESNISNLHVQRLVSFNQADINEIFDEDERLSKLAILSEKEMKETEGAYYWIYFYGPQIATASMWMYNSGWRTIPGWYHNIRQRW